MEIHWWDALASFSFFLLALFRETLANNLWTNNLCFCRIPRKVLSQAGDTWGRTQNRMFLTKLSRSSLQKGKAIPSSWGSSTITRGIQRRYWPPITATWSSSRSFGEGSTPTGKRCWWSQANSSRTYYRSWQKAPYTTAMNYPCGNSASWWGCSCNTSYPTSVFWLWSAQRRS